MFDERREPPQRISRRAFLGFAAVAALSTIPPAIMGLTIGRIPQPNRPKAPEPINKQPEVPSGEPPADLECKQVGHILPDPRCETPLLVQTPTIEQWDNMIKKQAENRDKFPFASLEK